MAWGLEVAGAALSVGMMGRLLVAGRNWATVEKELAWYLFLEGLGMWRGCAFLREKGRGVCWGR